MNSLNPEGFKTLSHIPHYYGDAVRGLFVLAAVIMLATLPFFNREIPTSIPVTLLFIAALGLLAGLTNPRERWVALLNTIISITAAIGFGYWGVIAYENYSITSWLFWTNEALAIIFLAALYYSAKTVRGMAQRKRIII